MAFLFSNNAQTTLAESLTSTATTLNVVSGKGTLFPAPSNGDLFAVTLTSANNPDEVEICHCSAVNGDTLTIARGKDGTTAQSFSAGDLVSLFPTAGVTSLFAQNGYLGSYSASVAADIGGYPLNAIVADSSSAGVYWVSTVAANTTAPGASGASWKSLFDGYVTVDYVSSNYVATSTTTSGDTDLKVRGAYYSVTVSAPYLASYDSSGNAVNYILATQDWVKSLGYTTLASVADVGYVSGVASSSNFGITNIQLVGYTGTDQKNTYMQVTTTAGAIAIPSQANVAAQIVAYAQPLGTYVTATSYSSDFNSSDSRIQYFAYGKMLQGFSVTITSGQTVTFPQAFSATPTSIAMNSTVRLDLWVSAMDKNGVTILSNESTSQTIYITVFGSR